MKEVTVTAQTSGYRSTIDARSYSLGANLKTGTGTLGDILRDVPSIQVDMSGNVSLRGDSSVTILVDGKSSALFSGPGRAQAVQSMSADQFERVEVMTNPSAGQTAEGSGGVINLISKHQPKGGAAPTSSGTLKAEIGTGGRYDLGGSGAYASGALSLSGGVDYRRSAFTQAIGTHYGDPDAETGALSPAEQIQRQAQRDSDLILYASLGYDIDAHDHLDMGLFSGTYREALNQNTVYQTDAVTGPLALDYLSPNYISSFLSITSETLGITHTLPGDGHSLSFNLSVSQGHRTLGGPATYAFSVPAPSYLYQNHTERSTFPQVDAKIDYKITLPNKAKFSLGYEGKFDWSGINGVGVQGSSAEAAVTDPAFFQHFSFDQQVNALYATYEKVFGKLTIQPGLRAEYTSLNSNLRSEAQSSGQSYVEAFPSLHLDYALDPTSDVKASYGRRIERPNGAAFDPFHYEISQILYGAGNPNLKPAITQSWEMGYEYRKKTNDLQATLFYRDKSNVVAPVLNDIGDNVLLSTQENLGQTRNAGIELVANHDLAKNLTLNTSADFQHIEVDPGNLGLDEMRTAFSSAGHVTINWQIGKNDFFQLGAQASGRGLTAQGYYGSAIFSNLGWRHLFNPKISMSITAQDPFGLSRQTIETDTATLVDLQKRKFNYTAAFFSLTYAFDGASKHAADSFDFGARHGGP